MSELVEELKKFAETFEKLSKTLVRAVFVQTAVIYFEWAIWMTILALLMATPILGVRIGFTSWKGAFLISYYAAGIILINYFEWPSTIDKALEKRRRSEYRKARIVNGVMWFIGGLFFFIIPMLLWNDAWWTLALLILLGFGNTGIVYYISVASGRVYRIDYLIASTFFLAALADYWMITSINDIVLETFFTLSASTAIYLVLGLLNLKRALR